MQKIKSLFKRDYEGTRQVYNEVVPDSAWVLSGEGVATVKIDGTSCMVRDGKLYKRYDRKRKGDTYKDAPEGWEAAEDAPDSETGHWPGWMPVGASNEDQWHREGYAQYGNSLPDGTYELVGPKVQGNPHKLRRYRLWRHGELKYAVGPPRDFDGLREWFETHVVEGIVWHHKDGRMVKIKRRDFGLPWPMTGEVTV